MLTTLISTLRAATRQQRMDALLFVVTIVTMLVVGHYLGVF